MEEPHQAFGQTVAGLDPHHTIAPAQHNQAHLATHNLHRAAQRQFQERWKIQTGRHRPDDPEKKIPLP